MREHKTITTTRHIPSEAIVCQGCGGDGTRYYSNTATWHGGMGGNTCTTDICDKCWGSGAESHPWLNLRALQNQTNQSILLESQKNLFRGFGGLDIVQPAIQELIKELEKFSRGRKPRPRFFHEVCLHLVKQLTKPEIP